MGRKDVIDPHRRKGPAGTGRRRLMERRTRQRSVKDAQQQLAELKRAQQEKLQKAANIAAAKARTGKRKKAGKEEDPINDGGSEGSDIDDGPKKKKKKGATNTPVPGESRSTGFEKAFKPETPQALEFRRCFWAGPTPEGEPDDALKLARKELGVKVRGVPVPPPVQKVSDQALPVSFRQMFCSKQSGGIGIEKPTPIQAQVWPAALCGLDVIGIAPTGSGKTLAYLAPAVPHILGQEKQDSHAPSRPSVKGFLSTARGKGVVCLVLVPTRELAKQVADVCGGGSSGGWLKRLFGLRAGAMYGGTGKEVQLDSVLTMGAPQILAATPGRLLDLLGLDVFNIDQVTYLVLDEADRMLALGFEPQLSALMRGICPNRQVLLFSATFPLKLRNAAEQWMSGQRVVIRVDTMALNGESAEGQTVQPAEGEDNEEEEQLLPEGAGGAATAGPATGGGGGAADAGDGAAVPAARVESSGPSTLTVSPTVHQIVKVCKDQQKSRKLVRLLQRIRAHETAAGTRQRSAVLVFCSEIKVLKSLAKAVERQGERCAALHSGIPQAKREEALADLKSGKVDTLLATDVASRGIHVTRLRYVVNVDFPRSIEVYCHRIGRVGRQGAEGWAYSFVTKDSAQLAPGLVSLLERCSQPVAKRLQAVAEGRDPGQSEDSGGEEEAGTPGPVAAAKAGDAEAGTALKPGVAVLLQGLQSAPQLNGTHACICRWLPRTGRWEVVLRGEPGTVKALKPQSLTLVAGSRPKASARAGGLATGVRVALSGLSKAPQLNDARAHVRRKVAGTDRWEVVLNGGDEVKAVRAENLKVLAPERAGDCVSESSSDDDDGKVGDGGSQEAKSNAATANLAPEKGGAEEGADEAEEESAEEAGSEDQDEEESEEEAPDHKAKLSKSKRQRMRRLHRDKQRQQQQQQQLLRSRLPQQARKRTKPGKKLRERKKRRAAGEVIDGARP